jgi:hypothetical protein
VIVNILLGRLRPRLRRELKESHVILTLESRWAVDVILWELEARWRIDILFDIVHGGMES